MAVLVLSKIINNYFGIFGNFITVTERYGRVSDGLKRLSRFPVTKEHKVNTLNSSGRCIITSALYFFIYIVSKFKIVSFFEENTDITT
jgi:hypothetical protein